MHPLRTQRTTPSVLMQALDSYLSVPLQPPPIPLQLKALLVLGVTGLTMFPLTIRTLATLLWLLPTVHSRVPVEPIWVVKNRTRPFICTGEM